MKKGNAFFFFFWSFFVLQIQIIYVNKKWIHISEYKIYITKYIIAFLRKEEL
jgi:hypothetical protein